MTKKSNQINNFVQKLTQLRQNEPSNNTIEYLKSEINQKPSLLVQISTRNKSLLTEICCSTINPENIEDYKLINELLLFIINHENFQLLENDQEHLLEYMIDNNSGRFNEEVINALIEKRLKSPSLDSIKNIFKNTRSGLFIADLAMAFAQRGNTALAEEILNKKQPNKKQPNNIQSYTYGQEFYKNQKKIESLKNINKDTHPNFINVLAKYYINQNSDYRLNSLLGKVNISQLDQAEILILTAKLKHIKTFGILIDKDFNPLSTNEEGQTFLHNQEAQSPKLLEDYLYNIKKNHNVEIIKELVNMEDNNRKTPIDIAIETGYLRSVKHLVENGAKIKKKHLIKAINNKDSKIFAFLLDNFQSQNTYFLEDIINLVTNTDDERPILARIIVKGFQNEKPDSISESYWLELSITSQKKELIQPHQIYAICATLGSDYLNACLKNMQSNNIILENALNIKDSDEKTPLYHAVEGKCYFDNVEILIKSGANPNEKRVIDLAIEKSEVLVLGLLVKNLKKDKYFLTQTTKKVINAKNQELMGAFLDNLSPEKFELIDLETKENLFNFLKKHKLDDNLRKIEGMTRNTGLFEYLETNYAQHQVQAKPQNNSSSSRKNIVYQYTTPNPNTHVNEHSPLLQYTSQNPNNDGPCCCVMQ